MLLFQHKLEHELEGGLDGACGDNTISVHVRGDCELGGVVPPSSFRVDELRMRVDAGVL